MMIMDIHFVIYVQLTNPIMNELSLVIHLKYVYIFDSISDFMRFLKIYLATKINSI